MTTLHIPAFESGQIRVFAINRPVADMTRMIEEHSARDIAHSLLGHDLAEGGAEVFAISDLTGVGLSRYLGDGYAVPADQLETDRRRLDALEGFVLLLFSQAFEDKATALTVGEELTLIGTYGELQPALTGAAPPSEAARRDMASGSGTASDRPRSRGGSLVVAGLLVGAVLVLWLILR